MNVTCFIKIYNDSHPYNELFLFGYILLFSKVRKKTWQFMQIILIHFHTFRNAKCEVINAYRKKNPNVCMWINGQKH